jgi:hypothetical protein
MLQRTKMPPMLPMAAHALPVERDVVNPSEKPSHIFKALCRHANSFGHETLVERNSLEDANHVCILQYHFDDSGRVLRGRSPERCDTAGECLPY